MNDYDRFRRLCAKTQKFRVFMDRCIELVEMEGPDALFEVKDGVIARALEQRRERKGPPKGRRHSHRREADDGR